MLNTEKCGVAGSNQAPDDLLLSIDAELRFGPHAIITHHNGTGTAEHDPSRSSFAKKTHGQSCSKRLCGLVLAQKDSSGGTASDTNSPIVAGATYSQADMQAAQNAIASLTAKLNTCIAVLKLMGAIHTH